MLLASLTWLYKCLYCHKDVDQCALGVCAHGHVSGLRSKSWARALVLSGSSRKLIFYVFQMINDQGTVVLCIPV